MNKTAIIIQARMGSSRLLGKVLEPLGDETVLWHVIKRAEAVDGVDIVCCAIPNTRDSDLVAKEAERCGAIVVRGDELDVLARYHQAAVEINAKIIMRITSDCPLIDPVICTRVLKLVKDGSADYACNNMPPSFPHGLDCEAFTFAALDRARQDAQQPYEREHVTPWIRNCSDLSHQNVLYSGDAVHHHRWTLDYPEDLIFFRTLFEHFQNLTTTAGMDQILDILKSHPDIQTINSMHIDRPLNSMMN